MKPILLRASQVRRLIPRRPKSSYKGKNGHVLVVAGSSGMTGAAYLCSLGALKAGAGLVTVAGPTDVRKVISQRLPEAMTIPPQAAGRYVRRRTITTLAVGPGLGVGKAQKRLVERLLAMKLPVVLDADGLNNLASMRVRAIPSLILTPHTGELTKLLRITRSKVEKNRIELAKAAAAKFSAICILKGNKTIVTDGHRVASNTTGNPAMATGGMGDVLTGIISALLAQGLSLFDAACAGVFVHGLAGDIAAASDRGLLASELANTVPRALRKLGLS
jgi:hydroxyethylthiazole kinase-like uncharacterized protein yjeF